MHSVRWKALSLLPFFTRDAKHRAY